MTEWSFFKCQTEESVSPVHTNKGTFILLQKKKEEKQLLYA